MLPETLDNGLRSPNNNTGLPRMRGSLCLSPVTGTFAFVDSNKRRSWCGTPSTGAIQNFPNVRRYGELGHFKPRYVQQSKDYCKEFIISIILKIFILHENFLMLKVELFIYLFE